MCKFNIITYQSNRNFNTPMPGHLSFPWAGKLFKCPVIGLFQVIKCPHFGHISYKFNTSSQTSPNSLLLHEQRPRSFLYETELIAGFPGAC